MKWVLDPGHGGMSFGHYLTPGKRSPQVPPGIYEGEFNRAVCELIRQRDEDSIITLAPGPVNIPLKARVSYVNQLIRKLRGEPVALISVHANAAAKSGWADASGIVVFHSRIASRASRTLAGIALDWLSGPLINIVPRGIKQANHTITTKTKCPAILVECGFMTNRIDAEILASHWGRVTFAEAIYCAMREYEAQL